MGLWVKTTVEVNDDLLLRAKRVAVSEGVTLKVIFEEGLRLTLLQRSRATKKRKRVRLPVSKATGGVLAGVDLTDSASLEDLMND